MIRTVKNTLIAVTLAASTTLAAPAIAGGSFSFEVSAKNADEARAIRNGLTLYQVVNDIHTNGHITQRGINNIAAMAQGGHGHTGVIHQEGNGHNASLQQTGNNNAYGIFQFGENANGHVQQSGNGQAGLLFQVGF